MIGWKNLKGGRGHTDESRSAEPLISRLHREVSRYDWRLSNIDLLKRVYHTFIPREVRHDFGEYYTPDWLAEAICERVLDDAWCRNAVRRASSVDDDLKGIGVLDPGCGSGTFLRAAINRLKPFVSERIKDQVEQSNVLCKLVHGIDVHPVAVELARATVLAALPDRPTYGTSNLQVFLGDSLQWQDATDMRLWSSEGLLIEVPEDSYGNNYWIVIPDNCLSSDKFDQIVSDIVKVSDRLDALRIRLRDIGVSKSDLEVLIETAKVIDRLKSQGRDHIWEWYIRNLAQPKKLSKSKVDRMVANPPWITRADLRNDRQKQHEAHARATSVWVGGKQAPNNDLATLFVAGCAGMYLERSRSWKIGMVLPHSALRSGSWERFRAGCWDRVEKNWGIDPFGADLTEAPWDMKGVIERPFPQSESCVIFGRRPDGEPRQLSPKVEMWSAEIVQNNMSWREVSELVQRKPLTALAQEPSYYRDVARRGAMLNPIGLVVADTSSISTGGAGKTRFSTRVSSKGDWQGVSMQGTVENECLTRVVSSRDIGPHRVFGKTYAILPTASTFSSDDPGAEIAKYPMFDTYWAHADTIWRAKRKSSSPETLLKAVNHTRKLSSQFKSQSPITVVYPKSGAWFFGVAVRFDCVVDSGCYRIGVNSDAEAMFLCACFSATSLKTAFEVSRKSDRDFHTYPLRSVPIPKYDANDPLHAELARLGLEAEKVAASVPHVGGQIKMRAMIRGALKDDGVSGEIDRCIRELLPGYAKSVDD